MLSLSGPEFWKDLVTLCSINKHRRSKFLFLQLKSPVVILLGDILLLLSLCGGGGVVTASPRHQPCSFLQPDFLSPINVLLFSRGCSDGIPCSVSCCERPLPGYGRRERSQGSFFSFLAPAAGVRARAQRWATAPPRPHSIFTISQLLVTVATGFHAPKVVYINPEWSLCNCRGSAVAAD